MVELAYSAVISVSSATDAIKGEIGANTTSLFTVLGFLIALAVIWRLVARLRDA
jgi:hypothetical protein